MTNDTRERIERAARSCENALHGEALARDRGRLDVAAEWADAADHWSGVAFDLAMQS